MRIGPAASLPRLANGDEPPADGGGSSLSELRPGLSLQQHPLRPAAERLTVADLGP
jgi:hypothetical protein